MEGHGKLVIISVICLSWKIVESGEGLLCYTGSMHASEPHKTLKFVPVLVDMILAGDKWSTWRLWDDKDLTEGDVVDLFNKETGEQFGTARIVRVVEKPLGELTDADKVGHEGFASDGEMYATYTRYYNREVSPESLVKISLFKME